MSTPTEIKKAGLTYRSEMEKAGITVKAQEERWNLASSDDLTHDIALLMARCAKGLKVEPQDLTWYDFKEFTGYAFGTSGKEGIVPKHITKVGGFGRIRDMYFPPKATTLSVEREEIAERSKINRSVALQESRDMLFLEQWQQIASKVFKNKIQPSPYKPRRNGKVERHLNLLLSDLHFHSLLDPEEVPLRYGPNEEARRFAKVLLSTAEYKLDHRDQTDLNVFLAGDIIQNQLHDMRDGAPLAEQVSAATWYLIHGLQFLSQNFRKVRVYCAVGNHGRNMARHKSRATNQKWDAIEQQIYFAVKMALKDIPNVEVALSKRPYIVYESFGQKGFVTHGDTVIKPGYPGRTINVRTIEEQLNRLNATLPDVDEFKLFAVGHVHIGSATHMSNGSVFITNGALIPTDPYGVSLGYLESACGQYLWESVPGYIFGDSRFITVDAKTDQNADLEKIIKPFPGF